jgi:hypothetical protein
MIVLFYLTASMLVPRLHDDATPPIKHRFDRQKASNFLKCVATHVSVWSELSQAVDATRKARKSAPSGRPPWDLWARKIRMGINGEKVIIFWS